MGSPRIRGKDLIDKDGIDVKEGSPPHTRERLYNITYHTTLLRITPAYAGKTLLTTRSLTLFQDHPRIRGKDSPTKLAVFHD